MNYKILYIEDQLAKTIQDDLSKNNFIVDVNNANNFEDVLDHLAQDYDAYLMDFRLTANQGRVDAPSFASTIRTEGDNHRKRPIILITNENYLSVFENDFTSQDLFDFVITKTEFRSNIEKYSNRIKDLIRSYKLIEEVDFDMVKVLGISDLEILDYRLIQKLDLFRRRKDIYGFCRTINFSLIRSSGLLIGDEILASRLGVNITGCDFDKLKDAINSCRYNGILSTSYNRWWFNDVLNMWNNISDGKSLRRLNAKERVEILNTQLGLKLEPAEPIDHATSSNFWTICAKTLKPLDPNEGFIYSNKDLEDWQEQEFISLYAALEYPEVRSYLSPLDRKEILDYAF